MTVPLLERLRVCRAVLGGVDVTGSKTHPSMFDSDVLSFAHGDGTRRPHPDVIAAGVTALLDSASGSLDDYHFLQQHEGLDEAVVADFERSGIPAEHAGNVCVDSGTTRLFSAFLHACSRPGDVFLVPTSYYHPLPSWCDLFKVGLSLIKTDSEESYKLTGEAIDRHLASDPDRTRRARGLFLFNPTQTGALYTADELKNIAAAVFEHDLVVLEDSVFAGTEFPGMGQVVHLTAAVPEVADRVVTLKGASKAFNLANIRIGWGCGPADIIQRMNDHTVTTMATVPHLTKSMALAAIRAPAHYLRDNSRECAGRAALITDLVNEVNDQLAELAGGPVLRIPHQPQAGHGILLSADGLIGRARRGGPAIRNSVDVARLLLTEAKVAVSPGYSLGFTGAELRLAFGSVGLKHTYAETGNEELLSAVDSITSRCGTSQPSVAQNLRYLSGQIRSEPSQAAGAGFRSGRDLIAAAFRDRITPALAGFLRESR